MTDSLEVNTARALASRIADAGKTSTIGLDRLLIRGLIETADEPIVIRLPDLPEVDTDYRGMAARNGNQAGLSADLERELREIEDAPDPEES